MHDLNDYIEYREGNIPLVLSIPHGGSKNVSDIPNRTSGVLGTDRATIQLGLELMKCIQDQSAEIGKSPSLIISHIHRIKIDLNRSQDDAFNPKSQIAREIYSYYHKVLNNLVLRNIHEYKRSVLIDIHGFEKHKRPPGFRDVDLILGTENLNTLFSKPVPKKDWNKNIRGLIIRKFLNLNISIAPGHPRRREYVLTGGYITQKYGSQCIANSQAIQIEFSDTIRLYDEDLKNKVLISLSEVILDFFAKNSNIEGI